MQPLSVLSPRLWGRPAREGKIEASIFIFLINVCIIEESQFSFFSLDQYCNLEMQKLIRIEERHISLRLLQKKCFPMI